MVSILEAAEATRLKLREQGHSPIPVKGKRPLIKGWTELGNISAEEISRLTVERADHTNTGVLTALSPVLDIDIKDAAAAEAAEQLVRERFGDSGKILIRIGSAPKRAIPFQTAKPFDKISVDLLAPNGDTSQKIELMCDGQQVVVDGVHPDTGKPYAWFGGDLTQVSRYDLPHLNEAEAQVLVHDVVELLVTEHGYTLASGRPKKANGNGHATSSGSFDDLLVADPAGDWAYLIDKILKGADLHTRRTPCCRRIDSQSVKAPEAKTRGYDAGKKIVGRKRHIAVDTDGRLLMVNLTTADISDSVGAQMILDSVRKRWPWLKHLFADSAYDRTKLMDKAAFLDFTIEIIKRSDTAQGFEVLPRRWVVQRTSGWMTRWRRLVRDYEERIDCSQPMIHVALGSILLRRIAHQ